MARAPRIHADIWPGVPDLVCQFPLSVRRNWHTGFEGSVEISDRHRTGRSPGRRALVVALAVVGEVRQFVAARTDAQPPQLLRAVEDAAPGAPHALADAHDAAGTDVDDVVVEAHLPTPRKEHVQLLDASVRVPVAGFLTWLERVRAHADVLHGEVVVDDATALSRTVGAEAAVVCPPLVGPAHLQN